ncbi:hypothetical protein [Mariniplasma anaerobium]|uniref:Uncharacterized protein n=1 Tax=Mariniplasma anaerobium TaxID=2735436 RepID=A0A7U9TH85_9MOLU|nr:hypothetical protein [Mariniplasma anaerobium]BCR35187.1 hypothetical protein MPAN_000800 [Mariniplasma anaerobium]
MKANEFREAMCQLVSAASNIILLNSIDGGKVKSRELYFKEQNNLSEEDIAKCILQYFYKAWYTKSRDFIVMSQCIENVTQEIDINIETFINSQINHAISIEKASTYKIDLYPLIVFEDNDYKKGIYIKLYK